MTAQSGRFVNFWPKSPFSRISPGSHVALSSTILAVIIPWGPIFQKKPTSFSSEVSTSHRWQCNCSTSDFRHFSLLSAVRQPSHKLQTRDAHRWIGNCLRYPTVPSNGLHNVWFRKYNEKFGQILPFFTFSAFSAYFVTPYQPTYTFARLYASTNVEGLSSPYRFRAV